MKNSIRSEGRANGKFRGFAFINYLVSGESVVIGSFLTAGFLVTDGFLTEVFFAGGAFVIGAASVTSALLGIFLTFAGFLDTTSFIATSSTGVFFVVLVGVFDFTFSSFAQRATSFLVGATFLVDFIFDGVHFCFMIDCAFSSA